MIKRHTKHVVISTDCVTLAEDGRIFMLIGLFDWKYRFYSF